MKKSEIKNSAELFLYKANVDLKSAKYLLDGYENDLIDIDIEKIYFELQQCAEKSLKSILTKNNIKFNKTHDIEYLIDKCIENNIELIEEIEELIELSDYAVEGRYSIIHDDINESNKYIKILDILLSDLQGNK